MPTPSQKHGRNPEPRDNQSRGAKKVMMRKRTVLACEECRVRKRRCDGAIPACGGCTKRRSECIYSSEVEAREWNYTMIQSLRQRLEELENTADMTPRPGDAQVGAIPEQQQQLSLQDQQAASTKTAEEPHRAGSAVENHPADVCKTLSGSVTTLSSPADIELVGDHQRNFTIPATANPIISDASARPEWNAPRSFESSNFERLMKPIGRALDRKTDASKSTASMLSTDLASPASPETFPPSAIVSCTCRRLVDAGRWQLPLKRQADGLIAIYFARHARLFPVLHRPTFLKQYEALWASRTHSESEAPTCVGICKQKDKGRLFPSTVNTIFAIAALFSSRHAERNANYAAEFFRLSEQIDILDMLNEELGLECVQLALLMGFYLQSTERFSKCWNIAGLALRMAQSMGLHFSISDARKRGLMSSPPTQMECEMRRRVWHACMLLECEVSMTFAQPLMIPAGGKTVQFPEAIDDSRLSDDVGQWNQQPKDLPCLLEYYVHTLKLYEILCQVLDRHELKADTQADPICNIRWILSLDCRIMEWRDNLPPYLRYDSSLPEYDPLKAVAMLEPFLDTDVVLGFPDLTRRLHCRFLCVRQLILRPALDLLFERQQTERPVPIPEPKVKAKLKDSIITNVALQCVLTAIELVEFLVSQIQTSTFGCWWYNIHYLHTCGSTILLGRLCTFDGAGVPRESLLSSWDLCLRHLAQYDSISSVAQKSSQLLRDSAKRLLRNEGTDFTVNEKHHPQPINEPENITAGFMTDTVGYSATSESLEHILGNSDDLETSRPLGDFFGTDDTDAMPLIEGQEAWNSAPFGSASWMFIPPISQLDSFSLQYEDPNIVQP